MSDHDDDTRAKAEAWDRIAEQAHQSWQTTTGLGAAVRRIVAEVEHDDD